MKRGYFITGTDTGVGKTFVARAIAGALARNGVDVGVMKPVESGCPTRDGRLVPADALALKRAAGAPDSIDAINPYRFAAAIAPNVAARLEDKDIKLSIIKKLYDELSARHDMMIVEGAGGLLSPVTDSKSAADLAALLELPLIVVVPSTLGCINHLLLTLRAAEEANLSVAGVILNHPAPPDATDKSMRYNLEEIKRLASVPVLGEVPYLEDGTAAEAGKYIDLGVFG
jgi:dethiobiotin synthetase